MTLAQYARILRAQWMVVLGLTILGALGASIYSFTATPVYSADAQLFVTVNGANQDSSSLQQGSTFTQQRVKSYAQVITAPEVLDPVIQKLGLTEDAQTLAKSVSASSPLDTVLLDVTVKDTSPTRARDIANAIGNQFSGYVQQLELPSSTSGQSPVKVTLTSPATTPTVPDSPRKSLNLALGLLVGLALGLGLAFLRDSLDRTIGGKHDAAELTGAPVLTAVQEDPAVKTAPLVVEDAFSPRAEAFRTLRTNIRFLSVDREVRSLVVSSSVAGEGKSTTSANLALVIAQGGEKVVLVDADLRRPALHTMLGLTAGVGLTSVLVGDVPVEEALQQWRDDLPLQVLTSGPVPPNPSELIGSQRMSELVDALVADGYVVVVGSPPLLPVTDAAILARITDGALVVAKARSTRTDQLQAAAETLRTAGAGILGVVVNCVGKGGRYGYGGYSYEAYSSYRPEKRPTESPAHVTPAPAVPSTTPRLGAPAPLPRTTATQPAPDPVEQRAAHDPEDPSVTHGERADTPESEHSNR